MGQIDPSFISWSGTATALSSVYDSLVGPARRGGSDGTRVVPNLASSLPVTTAGGTTYAFQLRRGIRYSDGTLVKASDFRRAFERPLRAGIPQVAEAPLVGSGACEKQPRELRSSRGIRTDDATGTIVFHLRRPERGFLSVLIRVFPIPRGTPDRNMGTRPVASTGPYMIESYVPGRALTLVRNPYFGVWARAARPDGFPRDPVQTDRPARGSRPSNAGGPTSHSSSSQTEDVKALAESRARYPSQVHVHPARAIVFLFLNTTHPPFDDVAGAATVNYAIDRGAISGSYGGPGFAEPTCQPRVPGTVAFQRYCPYTAAPGQTGEWKAPHLAAARRLVAASGTRGMKVTTGRTTALGAGRGGSGPSAREAGLPGEYQAGRESRRLRAEFEDKKTLGVQAGMMGWFERPPGSLIPPHWFHVQTTQSQLLLRPASRRRDRAGSETRDHRPRRRAGAVDEGRARRGRPCTRGAAVHPDGREHRLQARRQLPVQPRVGDPVRSALRCARAAERRVRQCS